MMDVSTVQCHECVHSMWVCSSQNMGVNMHVFTVDGSVYSIHVCSITVDGSVYSTSVFAVHGCTCVHST